MEQWKIINKIKRTEIKKIRETTRKKNQKNIKNK